VPGLVQADDPAEVEQHLAVSTPGQAEGDPFLRLGRGPDPRYQALRDVARVLHHGGG